MKKHLSKLFVIILLYLLKLSHISAHTENGVHYNIIDYGAIGDSLTNCTKAIQSAIDACNENGGGIVKIPSGIYMSGTLVIKDNVVLDLNAGSEIQAIPDINEFTDKEPNTSSNFNIIFRQAFIYAEDAKNIGITGQGTINGQGQAEVFKITNPEAPWRYQNRPTLLRIVNCDGVRLENVQIVNSAFWTIHLMASRDIVVHGISLNSRTANHNNDGIDVDGCEDVRISDCYINSLDDAISIKATGNNRVRRVMINNCLLSSHCNAVRVGAENFAGFEDIHFSNCHIFESRNGITLQNIDGFKMQRISFQGISLYEVGVPVYIITGRESYPIGVPEEEYPCLPGNSPAPVEDLVFDNITGNKIGYYRGIGLEKDTITQRYRSAIVLSGHNDAPLLRCKMSNINFHFQGGGTIEDSKDPVPEVNNMPNPGFNTTPVYGVIARFTKNLVLTNVNLSYEKKDVRSAMVIENSTNTILKDLNIQSGGILPVIQYHNNEEPYVMNCTELVDNGKVIEINRKNGNIKRR